MTAIPQKYMCVSIDFVPEGMSISVWFSTQPSQYTQPPECPYKKFYYGDECVWEIHSNIQMTPKVYEMVCEYADRICREQKAKNATRKLANR